MSIGSIKKALNTPSGSAVAPHQVNQWFKVGSWAIGETLVAYKCRWCVVLASLGLAIWIKLTPIFKAIQLIEEVLGVLATILPAISVVPSAALRSAVDFLGQTRTVGQLPRC